MIGKKTRDDIMGLVRGGNVINGGELVYRKEMSGYDVGGGGRNSDDKGISSDDVGGGGGGGRNSDDKGISSDDVGGGGGGRNSDDKGISSDDVGGGDGGRNSDDKGISSDDVGGGGGGGDGGRNSDDKGISSDDVGGGGDKDDDDRNYGGKEKRTSGGKEENSGEEERNDGGKERTGGGKERTGGGKERTGGGKEENSGGEEDEGKEITTSGEKDENSGGEEDERKEITSGEKEENSGEQDEGKEITSGEKEEKSGEEDDDDGAQGEEAPPSLLQTHRAPDGGWGWVVAMAAAVIMMVVPVMGPCFGVLFSRYLLESQASISTTAWIFNTHCFMWNVSSLFCMPLTREFGWQRVGICGAFVSSVGFMLGAFSPVPEFLFFSYAVLCGVGGGIVFTMCFLIVPLYFDRYRGTSNMIMHAGVGGGQILGPHFARWLQDHFGFRGATLIFGAVMLHGCVAAALFHPVEWHQKPRQKKKQVEGEVEEGLRRRGRGRGRGRDTFVLLQPVEQQQQQQQQQQVVLDVEAEQSIRLISETGPTVTKTGRQKQQQQPQPHNANTKSSSSSPSSFLKIFERVVRSTVTNLAILKSPKACIICFASTLCINSTLNFSMMVPFAVQDAGLSLDFAAWCLSVKGLCDLATRLVVNPLTDWSRFSVQACYVSGMALAAITTFMFPLVYSKSWLLVTMAAYGCAMGSCLGIHSLVMISVMGMEKMPAVFATSCFITAFGFISLGPLIGMIQDGWRSFKVSMWVLSFLMVVSVILWLMMGPAKRYENNRKIPNKKQHHAPKKRR
ncbi:hypothetical protein Pcinc_038236 [Petrolisthes cinctipes]|uniref:Uncharacterized protein n=1 Tax=Petrolisthes cinctipes TaxID=88211 RepID=A0AAE1EKL7_PETCI|nr:hypothetical protein Pcinc_038236 [Petrolisthes cinctipes]